MSALTGVSSPSEIKVLPDGVQCTHNANRNTRAAMTHDTAELFETRLREVGQEGALAASTIEVLDQARAAREINDLTTARRLVGDKLLSLRQNRLPYGASRTEVTLSVAALWVEESRIHEMVADIAGVDSPLADYWHGLAAEADSKADQILAQAEWTEAA